MKRCIFVLIQVIEFIVLKSENAYYIPNFRCRGRACKTNLPSNTAFRGFGFPQATVVVEAYITAVASKCNLLPEEVSNWNLTLKHWRHCLECILSSYNLYVEFFQENKMLCPLSVNTFYCSKSITKPGSSKQWYYFFWFCGLLGFSVLRQLIGSFMAQDGFIDISDEYLTGLFDYDSSEKCDPQSLTFQSASLDSSSSWGEGGMVTEFPTAAGKWHSLNHKHFSSLCLHHYVWSHHTKQVTRLVQSPYETIPERNWVGWSQPLCNILSHFKTLRDGGISGWAWSVQDSKDFKWG